MTMEFLLHKDKEKDNPPHIQHIAFCPTHESTLRKSQRAKFPNPPI